MPPQNHWPPRSSVIDFATYQAMIEENPHWRSTPDKIAWRINAKRVLVLGWPRAILLQFAHPMIAQGIAQHSDFAKSSKAKTDRFYRTLTRMLQLSFGTPEEVWKAARGVDAAHARVYGERESVPYAAREADLMQWVYATFVDSSIKAYETFIRPLSDEEKDLYVHQGSIVGPLLGAPVGYFPDRYGALDAYMRQMIEGDELVVDDQARELARQVLSGYPAPIIQPLSAFGLTLVTKMMLPDKLREAFNLTVTAQDKFFFDRLAQSSRTAHRVLPRRIHQWGMANRASR